MGINPEPSTPLLKKTLGLRTVVSTSAGLTFASSTFLVVVFIGYTLGGASAWIPILIAGLLSALAAAAFSELNGMYPTASGIRLWLHRAFGEKAALITALSYMSVVALVVGAEAYVLSYVLADAFPRIAPPYWIVLMLTVATAANLRGLKVAGALQDVITYAVVASIVVMSMLVLGRAHWHAPGFTHPSCPSAVLNMVGFAIFLFVGFEWVTPLAEEVREPKSIPYGMFIALGMLVVCYSLISTAMFAHAGVAASLYGTDASRYPIPHIRFALATLGPAGRIAMLVTSLCMSLTTFNAGLISVSRFLYASAREHVLPKVLERFSPRFSVPIAAIITVYVLALSVSLFVYFTKQYVILLNIAAATEALIYAFAAACVFMLRRKEASTARPYRMWGGLWLPAVTSILFFAVGVGVIFTGPGFEYWGAGLILAIVAAGWALYVQFVAAPRKERVRAEQAAKRQSRRPARPGSAPPSTSPASPILPNTNAADETA